MNTGDTTTGGQADSSSVYVTQELPAEEDPHQGTINLVVAYCRMGIVPKKRADIRRAIPTLNPHLDFDPQLLTDLTDKIMSILGLEA